jgi:hypothetical protein
MGLPRNGKHYRRLIDGFKCVFTEHHLRRTDDRLSERAIWESTRFAFFDQHEKPRLRRNPPRVLRDNSAAADRALPKQRRRLAKARRLGRKLSNRSALCESLSDVAVLSELHPEESWSR